MSDANLVKRVEELENKLGILEDVHAIRRLHHLYGYFLDKCMYDEVLPFHCEHPVTGRPIVTPEPGLRPE